MSLNLEKTVKDWIDADPDDATIAQWIAAARAEPEVEVVSPGRFGALPPAP